MDFRRSDPDSLSGLLSGFPFLPGFAVESRRFVGITVGITIFNQVRQLNPDTLPSHFWHRVLNFGPKSPRNE
jgi:hypothetical protein